MGRGDEEVAVGLADLADGGEEGAERVVQAADDVSVLTELQQQPVPRDQRPPHLRWGALFKGDRKGDKGDRKGDKGDMKVTGRVTERVTGRATGKVTERVTGKGDRKGDRKG